MDQASNGAPDRAEVERGSAPASSGEAPAFGAGILDEAPAGGRASETGAAGAGRGGRRRRRDRAVPARFEEPAASSLVLESSAPGAPSEGAVEPAAAHAPEVSPADHAPSWRRGRDQRTPRGPAGARPQHAHASPQIQAPKVHSVEGMVSLEKGGFGVVRLLANHYLPGKDDVFVPPFLVQRFKLHDGAVLTGRARRHQGQHKWALEAVDAIEGADPREQAPTVPFKKLVSIDPDFHYLVGDVTGDVSMRILDVVCPVGRGTRGLIVAPPRSGKTILMRKFAQGIEKGYPDVTLYVLLVDERPEEATEWQRSTKGQVFVSTNDESSRNHVELAEGVWKRCQRLVELGKDVVLLLDSITRLARAYNNLEGGSGRTLSGGLDSRAMERPRSFFGCARNTETAGSLTILGTTLVDTGSRLDQLVFEEFKGTGNMELVLSRKLADRRIFPAIDIEKSGTRKEEKLISARRLKQIHVLRRVLLKMNFVEAMELLVAKLEDVEKTDDFLKRFEIDPEA